MERRDLWNGVFLLLTAAFIWWQTTYFPTLEEGYPGPSLFPRMISIGLLMCGLVLLVRAFASQNQEESGSFQKRAVLRLGGGLLMVSLYPLLHPFLGFLPTLALICFGMGLLLGVKPWIALLSAVVTVLFIFLTFEQLLGVAL